MSVSTTNILERFRLDGKVAVVTGASSGLSPAIATALADAGADIALAGRRADRLTTVAADYAARAAAPSPSRQMPGSQRTVSG